MQYRRDAHLLPKLAPKSQGASSKHEARGLWRRFVEHVKPTRITRVGVRYINVLEFQLPITDVTAYLLTYPQLGPELPQEMLSSLMRMQMTDAASGGSVMVTQVANVRNDSGPLEIVFDIDAYSAANYAIDSDEAWDALEHLRDLKNRVFFGSFTEKALERYH